MDTNSYLLITGIIAVVGLHTNGRPRIVRRVIGESTLSNCLHKASASATGSHLLRADRVPRHPLAQRSVARQHAEKLPPHVHQSWTGSRISLAAQRGHRTSIGAAEALGNNQNQPCRHGLWTASRMRRRRWTTRALGMKSSTSSTAGSRPIGILTGQGDARSRVESGQPRSPCCRRRHTMGKIGQFVLKS